MSIRYLELSSVGIEFDTNGSKFRALQNVNLKLDEGEFVSLIGHSGCDMIDDIFDKATSECDEKENKMELFHNQVTREQGIFSYRFNHGSQGLYFLAENIDMPTRVLDFPTLDLPAKATSIPSSSGNCCRV